MTMLLLLKKKDATVVVVMILCVLILARSFVQPNHPEPSCFGLDEPGSVLCLSKAFSCSGHYRNSYGAFTPDASSAERAAVLHRKYMVFA
uniref:Secreted protein n=1 Tax=Salarias fasciatus TaxID=181472 RepID=A0A672FK54_SALFA